MFTTILIVASVADCFNIIHKPRKSFKLDEPLYNLPSLHSYDLIHCVRVYQFVLLVTDRTVESVIAYSLLTSVLI